ncbi:MAG: PTS sugar transporter subunit IIA [Treponema sp.]|nr:PTS sugar transporter subunit IIA [Treponema sp.]
MRIKDVLAPERIRLGAFAKDKADAIEQVVALMVQSGTITDRVAFHKGVLAREEESTTAVGEGVAIPHCKSSCVTAPSIAAMTFLAGVDYDAPDGESVKVLFLIAAPDTTDNVHVDVLSTLSVLLLDRRFTNDLLAAKTVDEFLAVVDRAESAKNAAAAAPTDATPAKFPRVLAVTGCPTGIAHTKMAAENLTRAAEHAGVTIKVETHGSEGLSNSLTDEDIEHADGIIVAADIAVPMARFNGRPVIQVRVADGIRKADELVGRVLTADVPLYRAAAGEVSADSGNTNGAGHSAYKHLMNGVSHMLPFVVGGGILIAIAFLIDGFAVDLDSLPFDRRGDFGTITPIAAFFKNTGGAAFGFMLPVLAGFIAFSIADRPGLALGFVGGVIAASGKSGFLGALVAGFLAGYAVLLLKKCCARLPKSLEGTKPVLLYPLFGILIMGLGMTFVVEPVVGAINTWLNNVLAGMGNASAVVMGLVLGGMMAVDMGGPVNKAAYVFGTAQIAAGNYTIMAAVMIGGMVPPIAIAAATIIFKRKFTTEERKAGPVNFIMGAAFITEGAIPYAASDPARVLPSCIVGSAVAGALSMLFKCTLMAPHGGIFVFPVVGNWPLYLVALLVGAAINCLMLGVLKKRVQE